MVIGKPSLDRWTVKTWNKNYPRLKSGISKIYRKAKHYHAEVMRLKMEIEALPEEIDRIYGHQDLIYPPLPKGIRAPDKTGASRPAEPSVKGIPINTGRRKNTTYSQGSTLRILEDKKPGILRILHPAGIPAK